MQVVNTALVEGGDCTGMLINPFSVAALYAVTAATDIAHALLACNPPMPIGTPLQLFPMPGLGGSVPWCGWCLHVAPSPVHPCFALRSQHFCGWRGCVLYNAIKTCPRTAQTATLRALFLGATPSLVLVVSTLRRAPPLNLVPKRPILIPVCEAVRV
uniref:Uncharacterized protein n=1 Tax=Eutreptiella gymnastica TaxID=73025 RepID=A0A7S1HXG9_9EUGL